MTQQKINAAIIGASGYTGAELLRLLNVHPQVNIAALVADSNAGKPAGDIYPHLKLFHLPRVVKLDQVDFSTLQVAFCCLPHGTSQEVIAKLYQQHPHLVIIDLSADFRLENPDNYAQWYGHAHAAPVLQKEAVYALSEHYADAVKNTRLIACPGCYPTSMLLPLLPLLKTRLIAPDNIIVDSKSGITGAGRSAKVDNLFAEANEDTRPYGIGGHRHVSEVEQELGKAAGQEVQITFTPHVVPMNRGIVSVIYVKSHKTIDELKSALQVHYANSSFVHVLMDNTVPTVRMVRGTNHAVMNLFADRVKGRVVIVSVIDNLVKGASGQAVQNMNLRFGFAENTGLDAMAIAF